MPWSRSTKAKAIQSRVRKQNICPCFSNKSTSSRIPTEQASFVSICSASIKHGMKTEDCGLGIEHGPRYETWAQHHRLNTKHGLRTKCGLPTAAHVFLLTRCNLYCLDASINENKPSRMHVLCEQFFFSRLLAGGQFHVYPIAQGQNFYFPTLSYQNLNALFNLRLLLNKYNSIQLFSFSTYKKRKRWKLKGPLKYL